MKKIMSIILAAVMLAQLSVIPAFAEGEGAGQLLPEDPAQFSCPLALKLLTLCGVQTQSGTAAVLTQERFTVLGQWNYDKSKDDPSHTCAYTLAVSNTVKDGRERPFAVIVFRGTSGYEWQSNFDVVPSRNDEPVFAENFSRAALEAYYTVKPVLDTMQSPVVAVCGFSRGAAVANLFGVLLDDERGTEDLYVYTFAAPRTVRGTMAEASYPNIFNFINPADAVPELPLSSWGFERAGNDILLPHDPVQAEKMKQGIAMLSAFAGSLTDYYTVRHSLTGSGEAEDGITAFEMMSLLVPMLSGLETGGFAQGTGSALMPEVSPESDIAPLLGMMSGLEGDDGMKLLMQHMPDTYAALLSQLTE